MSQASAADRKSIRAQEKRSAYIDRARGDFVRVMMSTIEGRLYVHEHLSTCHIFATTFNLNALQSAFAEGQRNIGLQLLNDVMRFCPEQYLPMMREANVRHDSDNRTSGPRSSEGTSAEQLDGSSPSGRDAEGSIDILGGDDYDPYRTEDA